MRTSPSESAPAEAPRRMSPDQLVLFKPAARPLKTDRLLRDVGPRSDVTRSAISQYHSEEDLVNAALELLRCQMASSGIELTSPDVVRSYLRLNLTGLEHEAFWCVFLDSRNRVLAAREMFRGTIGEFVAYPREVVKAALQENAVAVIFAHNHPSGIAEPTRADEVLTQTLKHALSIVEIRVLDHFVVGRDEAVSFVERGLL